LQCKWLRDRMCTVVITDRKEFADSIFISYIKEGRSKIQNNRKCIVWGIKMYRPYLFRQKFNIIINHRALVWSFIITNPGSKLTSWRLKLEEYQYTIHFKPGVNNTNANMLIRFLQVTSRIQSAWSSETHSDTPGQNISETQDKQGPLLQHEPYTSSDDSHATNKYHQFFRLSPNI